MKVLYISRVLNDLNGPFKNMGRKIFVKFLRSRSLEFCADCQIFAK